MSHAKAELAQNDSLLGPQGTLVGIQDVENAYRTADAAKVATTFRCADCRVSVLPVIPRRNVPNRLKSPSPHFRATSGHRTGCTRLPTVVQAVGPTANQMSGRPGRAVFPTNWRDALPSGPGPVVSTPGRGPLAAPSTSVRGARVSGPGNGTSRQSSTYVQAFAEAYIGMSAATRATAALKASWNPGGTYDTAFVGVGAKTVKGTQPPERIYFGEIATVYPGKSGYVLTLTHRHDDGKLLRIWLQKVIATKPAPGPQLWSDLTQGAIKPGMAVFALGEFLEQVSHGNQPNYCSMPITDAHRVWFTDM